MIFGGYYETGNFEAMESLSKRRLNGAKREWNNAIDRMFLRNRKHINLLTP